MNVKRFLGIAWAAPVTFFGLVYVLVFSVFGWLDWRRNRRASHE
jgi:hypothetical protein